MEEHDDASENNDLDKSVLDLNSDTSRLEKLDLDDATSPVGGSEAMEFLSFDKGVLQEVKKGVAGDFAFEITSKSLVYSQEHGKTYPLAKLVKECYPQCVSIWGHAPFAAGVVPGKLAKQKTYSFALDNKDVEAPLLRDLKSVPGINILWSMKYSEKPKSLIPSALGLFVQKQETIMPQSGLTLKTSKA